MHNWDKFMTEWLYLVLSLLEKWDREKAFHLATHLSLQIPKLIGNDLSEAICNAATELMLYIELPEKSKFYQKSIHQIRALIDYHLS